jgi:hypothetical protein
MSTGSRRKRSESFVVDQLRAGSPSQVRCKEERRIVVNEPAHRDDGGVFKINCIDLWMDEPRIIINESAASRTEGTFKSNCVDVWIDDEPGGDMVGPVSPGPSVGPVPSGPMLKCAKAERAKIYGNQDLKGNRRMRMVRRSGEYAA